MKRIKQIEGKTIVKAQHGGNDFQEYGNRTIQLEFSDGTTFCLAVEDRMKSTGIIYKDDNDPIGQTVFTF